MRLLSPLALAVLLLAAAPAAAQEDPRIVGGTVDEGHPAVVMIFYNLGNGEGIGCSGTVIAPTVILTAAHCTVTDENCVEPNCTTLTAANYTVSGGTTPFTSPTWTSAVTAVHTNPVYDGANITNGSDSGILILATAAPVTPVPWMARAASETYQQANSITVVGYGLTIQNGNDFGTKRFVNVDITNTVGLDNTFTIGNGGQGICNGDSGGPALMVVNSTGVETVIATTTAGPTATCGPGYETESAAIAASFIEQFVPGVTAQNPPNRGGGCEVGSGKPPRVIWVPLLALLGLALARRRHRG